MAPKTTLKEYISSSTPEMDVTKAFFWNKNFQIFLDICISDKQFIFYY